jgi:hypothetical protein
MGAAAMMQVMPNRGIMLDDRLDGLRMQAVEASFNHPIPIPVAVYIEALELQHIDRLFELHKQHMREIGWRPAPGSET